MCKGLNYQSCLSVTTKNTNSKNTSDPEGFEGNELLSSYVEAITDLDI